MPTNGIPLMYLSVRLYVYFAGSILCLAHETEIRTNLNICGQPRTETGHDSKASSVSPVRIITP